MTRIVTSRYRYKPPPRKKPQAAAIEVPTVITIRDKRRVRRLDAATGDPMAAQRSNAATPDELTAANDDRKSAEGISGHPRLPAIVTIRRRKHAKHTDVPDMTEEEHERRGDAANSPRIVATTSRKESRLRRQSRLLSPGLDADTDEALTARYRAFIAAKLGKRP